MNANSPRPQPVMPLHTHWNCDQLADAVPMRVSQMLDFSTDALDPSARASANAAALHGGPRARSFLPAGAMPLFRTR